MDSVTTAPVVQPDSVESFWRALVECGRPGFSLLRGTQLMLRWPPKLREIRLDGPQMLLSAAGQLSLPLPYPVKPISLQSGGTLLIDKTTRHLEVRV